MKERTIKELLTLLREHIVKQDGFSGMCRKIDEMYRFELIYNKEYKILTNYLKNNKPENTNRGYWWYKGDKQPRLYWIDEQLKNL